MESKQPGWMNGSEGDLSPATEMQSSKASRRDNRTGSKGGSAEEHMESPRGVVNTCFYMIYMGSSSAFKLSKCRMTRFHQNKKLSKTLDILKTVNTKT